MRQIATLDDPASAERFAGYLQLQGIQTQLLPEEKGTAIWVYDEDQVEQARRELELFRAEPTHSRYLQAAREARKIQRKTPSVAESLPTNADEGGLLRQIPLTLTLLGIALVVALLTQFGSRRDSYLMELLSITRYVSHGDYIQYRPGLPAIRSGEIWRLITPAFLHFDFLHLAFNGLMLLSLGGAVERARGTLKLLLLFVVLAVGSNVAEYYVQWKIPQEGGPALVWDESPLFGGLSGVLYGLFGYAWMKSRFEPELGLMASRETVLILMGWFIVCLIGLIPNVANVAHASGLLMGLAIGYAPCLWRKR